MASINIHPCYYPTSVVVVDDNPSFLNSFHFSLNDNLSYYLYDSASKALTDINTTPTASAFAMKGCFTTQSADASEQPPHGLEPLDISSLVNRAYNPNRFLEKSVVIVDYQMPEMDGISFCKSIKDKNIKKILISGTADAKIAVNAFNKGLIDRFFLKNDKGAIDHINEYIAELQNAYFAANTSVVKNLLSTHCYSFLSQPAFAEVFHSLCNQHAIVEYYLTSNPMGFVLISNMGESFSLLVLQEEEFDGHADIIEDQDGPLELYNLVRRKTAIPVFNTADGYYISGLPNWQKYVYPAQPLQANLPYYYALVRNPGHLGDLSQNLYPYNRHLQTLDKMAYSPNGLIN